MVSKGTHLSISKQVHLRSKPKNILWRECQQPKGLGFNVYIYFYEKAMSEQLLLTRM